MTERFENFWKDPRLPKGMKQGKGAARKAFHRVVPALVDEETLWPAIACYERCKPDWQAFCHLTTYLNQERWEDEYEDDNPVKHMSFEERREWSRKNAPKLRAVE